MKSALKSPKNSYRKLLLKKRDELLATFRLDPEALTVSIRTPDAVEFASKTAEQDVTAATGALRRQMLKEVEKALARVVGGALGFVGGWGPGNSPQPPQPPPRGTIFPDLPGLRAKN